MPLIPIVFPDVELVVTGLLRSGLASHGYAGVFVSNKRESQATAVWVRRDGGPVLADGLREAAGVGVNVFAPTEQEATDLARTVRALMLALPDGDPVVKVTSGLGPSPVADATPRRYMTFEVTVRGSAL